jgi:hypothetical protein
MSRMSSLRVEFRDRIPAALPDGILFVSLKYSTAAHNCCCGCGEKVVTPLKAEKWRLERHGESVSLSPSIGNWSLACQSHYWIHENQVEWAPALNAAQIAANRESDRRVLRDAHVYRARSERGFWGRQWDAIKNWFNRFL